jgi:hypothetical protein
MKRSTKLIDLCRLVGRTYGEIAEAVPAPVVPAITDADRQDAPPADPCRIPDNEDAVAEAAIAAEVWSK